MSDEQNPNPDAEPLKPDDLIAVDRLKTAFANLKAEMAKVIVDWQQLEIGRMHAMLGPAE